jgi:hypothetical protein
VLRKGADGIYSCNRIHKFELTQSGSKSILIVKEDPRDNSEYHKGQEFTVDSTGKMKPIMKSVQS